MPVFSSSAMRGAVGAAPAFNVFSYGTFMEDVDSPIIAVTGCGGFFASG